MKLFLKSLIFFLALSALSASCSKEGPIGGVVAGSPGLAWKKTALDQDTITTAGTLDTTIQSLGSYFGPIYVDVLVVTTGISGTIGATSWLQQSGDDGTNWATVDSVLITSGKKERRISTNVLGGNIRLFTVGDTATQSTKLDVSYLIAGKPE